MGGTKCEMRLDEDGFMPLNSTDGVPEGGAAHIWCHLHAGRTAGPTCWCKLHNKNSTVCWWGTSQFDALMEQC